MSPAPAQVPAQIPRSIDHSRRVSGKSSGPIACQALVRNEGTTSSAAACAGVMTTARRPIATVGSPRPTTPLDETGEHEDRRDRGESGDCHAPHIAGTRRIPTSDVANGGFGKDGCQRSDGGGWSPTSDLYAAADLRAATIWSAVRPTSSAM